MITDSNGKIFEERRKAERRTSEEKVEKERRKDARRKADKIAKK